MTTTTTLPPHVLAIDDDAAMRQLIADYLGENDLRVTTIATGAEMEKVLAEHAVDVVVLDLRLAGEDGMQLAKKLRETSEIPIIIVSGRQDEADRVMGLELGADDYITKPFSPRELLARVRAVLRRYKTAREVLPARNEKGARIASPGWELNLRTRRLTGAGGKRVELTNGEFSLLEAFCAAPQRVLSREQLLDLSRLHNAEVYDRSIDVQILRLRRKIESEPVAPEYIKTERGAGYIFDTPVASPVLRLERQFGRVGALGRAYVRAGIPRADDRASPPIPMPATVNSLTSRNVRRGLETSAQRRSDVMSPSKSPETKGRVPDPTMSEYRHHRGRQAHARAPRGVAERGGIFRARGRTGRRAGAGRGASRDRRRVHAAARRREQATRGQGRVPGDTLDRDLRAVPVGTRRIMHRRCGAWCSRGHRQAVHTARPARGSPWRDWPCTSDPAQPADVSSLRFRLAVRALDPLGQPAILDRHRRGTGHRCICQLLGLRRMAFVPPAYCRNPARARQHGEDARANRRRVACSSRTCCCVRRLRGMRPNTRTERRRRRQAGNSSGRLAASARGQDHRRAWNTALSLASAGRRYRRLSDRAYFIAHRDHPHLGVVLSDPLITQIERRAAIVMSRRLDKPDGTFDGIVQAVVDLEEFQRIYKAIDLGPGSAVNLLRDDGTMLVRQPPISQVVVEASPR